MYNSIISHTAEHGFVHSSQFKILEIWHIILHFNVIIKRYLCQVN